MSKIAQEFSKTEVEKHIKDVMILLESNGWGKSTKHCLVKGTRRVEFDHLDAPNGLSTYDVNLYSEGVFKGAIFGMAKHASFSVDNVADRINQS
jgi:hypothetical protein